MSFKIYTKTGDQGETGLFGGKRLPKSHLRIESYGTVDELNSYIGLVADLIELPSLKETLRTVQHRLFTIGSNLASDPDKENLPVPDITEADIKYLEEEMDRMDADLAPLKNFILPGGHPVVSHCHVARTVCRRAERRVVALAEESKVEPVLIRYLNRLSDYLFILSRYVGKSHNVTEVTWQSR